MKMKYTVAIAICIMLLTGCIRYNSEYTNNGRTSFKVHDSRHIYRIEASFNRSKTSQIARAIDDLLDTNNELEPRDLQGTISLEDDTRVYVKLRSGRLKIRFNKDENSETAFERMKELTDKLKATLYNSEAQLH